jgi:hypothetical protein
MEGRHNCNAIIFGGVDLGDVHWNELRSLGAG